MIEAPFFAAEERARQLEHQHYDKEAITAWEQALAIRRDLADQNQLSSDELASAAEKLATRYNALGVKSTHNDDYETAISYLSRAAWITDSTDSTFFRGHEDLRLHIRATTYNNFGCLERRRGNLELALNYLTQSCHFEGNQSASTNLNISALLLQLGRNQDAVKRAKQAVGLLLQQQQQADALSDTKRRLENRNLMVIAYHNLAMAQEFSPNPQERLESEDSYATAYAIAQRDLGSAHPTTLAIEKSFRTAQTKKGGAVSGGGGPFAAAAAAGGGGGGGGNKPLSHKGNFLPQLPTMGNASYTAMSSEGGPTQKLRGGMLGDKKAIGAVGPWKQGVMGGAGDMMSDPLLNAMAAPYDNVNRFDPQPPNAAVKSWTRKSSLMSGGVAASEADRGVFSNKEGSGVQDPFSDFKKDPGMVLVQSGANSPDRERITVTHGKKKGEREEIVSEPSPMIAAHKMVFAAPGFPTSTSSSKSGTPKEGEKKRRKQSIGHVMDSKSPPFAASTAWAKHDNPETESGGATKKKVKRKKRDSNAFIIPPTHTEYQQQQSSGKGATSGSRGHHANDPPPLSKMQPTYSPPVAHTQPQQHKNTTKGRTPAPPTTVQPPTTGRARAPQRGAVTTKNSHSKSRGTDSPPVPTHGSSTTGGRGGRGATSHDGTARPTSRSGSSHSTHRPTKGGHGTSSSAVVVGSGTNSGGQHATTNGLPTPPVTVPSKPPAVREGVRKALAAKRNASKRRGQRVDDEAMDNEQEYGKDDMVGSMYTRLVSLLRDEDMFEETYEAARTVQCLVRRRQAKKHVEQLIKARARETIGKVKHEEKCGLTLQAFFRGIVRRKKLERIELDKRKHDLARKHFAATKIQALGRGWMGRRKVQKLRGMRRTLHWAVTHIQNWMRQQLAKTEHRRRKIERQQHSDAIMQHERQRKAAITIQRIYKGYITRCKTHKLSEERQANRRKAQAKRLYDSSTVIAALWKGYVARMGTTALRGKTNQYLSHDELNQLKKHSAVSLQSVWRGYAVRKQAGPLFSMQRKLEAERASTRLNNAARTVQCWWRCVLAKRYTDHWRNTRHNRKDLSKKSYVATVLQACFRGKMVRRTMQEHQQAENTQWQHKRDEMNAAAHTIQNAAKEYHARRALKEAKAVKAESDRTAAERADYEYTKQLEEGPPLPKAAQPGNYTPVQTSSSIAAENGGRMISTPPWLAKGTTATSPPASVPARGEMPMDLIGTQRPRSRDSSLDIMVSAKHTNPDLYPSLDLLYKVKNRSRPSTTERPFSALNTVAYVAGDDLINHFTALHLLWACSVPQQPQLSGTAEHFSKPDISNINTNEQLTSNKKSSEPSIINDTNTAGNIEQYPLGKPVNRLNPVTLIAPQDQLNTWKKHDPVYQQQLQESSEDGSISGSSRPYAALSAMVHNCQGGIEQYAALQSLCLSAAPQPFPNAPKRDIGSLNELPPRKSLVTGQSDERVELPPITTYAVHTQQVPPPSQTTIPTNTTSSVVLTSPQRKPVKLAIPTEDEEEQEVIMRALQESGIALSDIDITNARVVTKIEEGDEELEGEDALDRFKARHADRQAKHEYEQQQREEQQDMRRYIPAVELLQQQTNDVVMGDVQQPVVQARGSVGSDREHLSGLHALLNASNKANHRGLSALIQTPRSSPVPEGDGPLPTVVNATETPSGRSRLSYTAMDYVVPSPKDHTRQDRQMQPKPWPTATSAQQPTQEEKGEELHDEVTQSNNPQNQHQYNKVEDKQQPEVQPEHHHHHQQQQQQQRQQQQAVGPHQPVQQQPQQHQQVEASPQSVGGGLLIRDDEGSSRPHSKRNRPESSNQTSLEYSKTLAEQSEADTSIDFPLYQSPQQQVAAPPSQQQQQQRQQVTTTQANVQQHTTPQHVATTYHEQQQQAQQQQQKAAHVTTASGGHEQPQPQQQPQQQQQGHSSSGKGVREMKTPLDDPIMQLPEAVVWQAQQDALSVATAAAAEYTITCQEASPQHKQQPHKEQQQHPQQEAASAPPTTTTTTQDTDATTSYVHVEHQVEASQSDHTKPSDAEALQAEILQQYAPYIEQHRGQRAGLPPHPNEEEEEQQADDTTNEPQGTHTLEEPVVEQQQEQEEVPDQQEEVIDEATLEMQKLREEESRARLESRAAEYKREQEEEQAKIAMSYESPDVIAQRQQQEEEERIQRLMDEVDRKRAQDKAMREEWGAMEAQVSSMVDDGESSEGGSDYSRLTLHNDAIRQQSREAEEAKQQKDNATDIQRAWRGRQGRKQAEQVRQVTRAEHQIQRDIDNMDTITSSTTPDRTVQQQHIIQTTAPSYSVPPPPVATASSAAVEGHQQQDGLNLSALNTLVVADDDTEFQHDSLGALYKSSPTKGLQAQGSKYPPGTPRGGGSTIGRENAADPITEQDGQLGEAGSDHTTTPVPPQQQQREVQVAAATIQRALRSRIARLRLKNKRVEKQLELEYEGIEEAVSTIQRVFRGRHGKLMMNASTRFRVAAKNKQPTTNVTHPEQRQQEQQDKTVVYGNVDNTQQHHPTQEEDVTVVVDSMLQEDLRATERLMSRERAYGGPAMYRAPVADHVQSKQHHEEQQQEEDIEQQQQQGETDSSEDQGGSPKRKTQMSAAERALARRQSEEARAARATTSRPETSEAVLRADQLTKKKEAERLRWIQLETQKQQRKMEQQQQAAADTTQRTAADEQGKGDDTTTTAAAAAGERACTPPPPPHRQRPVAPDAPVAAAAAGVPTERAHSSRAEERALAEEEKAAKAMTPKPGIDRKVAEANRRAEWKAQQRKFETELEVKKEQGRKMAEMLFSDKSDDGPQQGNNGRRPEVPPSEPVVEEKAQADKSNNKPVSLSPTTVEAGRNTKGPTSKSSSTKSTGSNHSSSSRRSGRSREEVHMEEEAKAYKATTPKAASLQAAEKAEARRKKREMEYKQEADKLEQDAKKKQLEAEEQLQQMLYEENQQQQHALTNVTQQQLDNERASLHQDANYINTNGALNDTLLPTTTTTAAHHHSLPSDNELNGVDDDGRSVSREEQRAAKEEKATRAITPKPSTLENERRAAELLKRKEVELQLTQKAEMEVRGNKQQEEYTTMQQQRQQYSTTDTGPTEQDRIISAQRKQLQMSMAELQQQTALLKEKHDRKFNSSSPQSITDTYTDTYNNNYERRDQYENVDLPNQGEEGNPQEARDERYMAANQYYAQQQQPQEVETSMPGTAGSMTNKYTVQTGPYNEEVEEFDMRSASASPQPLSSPKNAHIEASPPHTSSSVATAEEEEEQKALVIQRSFRQHAARKETERRRKEKQEQLQQKKMMIEEHERLSSATESTGDNEPTIPDHADFQQHESAALIQRNYRRKLAQQEAEKLRVAKQQRMQEIAAQDATSSTQTSRNITPHPPPQPQRDMSDELAAVKIQSAFRASQARQEYVLLKVEKAQHLARISSADHVDVY